MMPEIDGPELVHRIRAAEHHGYVYIILLTSRALKEDVVEGMEAGADDFVTKPFDREELRVRLRAGERIVQLEQTLAEQKTLEGAPSSSRSLRQGGVVLNQLLLCSHRLALLRTNFRILKHSAP